MDTREQRIRALLDQLRQNQKTQARLKGQIRRAQLREALKVEDQVRDIHLRLRELRLTLGISQSSLSTALGRRSNVISRIETGRATRLTLERYAKLLALLGKDADGLFEE